MLVTTHKTHKIRVILYPSVMFYQTPVWSCCYQLLSVDFSLPRNEFKFENGNGKQNLKGVWTFLQNSGNTTVNGGFITEYFPSSTEKWPTCFMLISMYPTYPKYMQRRPRQEIFDRYTYIYNDKDTENFKIFFMRPCYSILGNNKNNYMEQIFKTSSGASTGPSTPFCWDLQEWGSDTILYTLKLSCDTHLTKLLSTFNCKT